jgi:hypothetical protein
MRTFQLTFLLLLTSFSLFAQQREFRDIQDFNAVIFEGRGDLILTPAQNVALEVEAKDGVDLSQLKTYVRGRTLHIEYQRNGEDVFDLYPKVTVYLSYTDLDELHCYGVVDARTTEPIVNGQFRYRAEGVGSSRLHVETDRLTVEIAGTANLYLAGSAYREVILLEGTGTLDAFDLQAEEVAAELNGLGSVYVHATESLFVDANGFAAQVKYKGNPKNKNINKSGWVNIKQVASH